MIFSQLSLALLSALYAGELAMPTWVYRACKSVVEVHCLREPPLAKVCVMPVENPAGRNAPSLCRTCGPMLVFKRTGTLRIMRLHAVDWMLVTGMWQIWRILMKMASLALRPDDDKGDNILRRPR